MPWNSTWPIGSISVKANRTAGQQNTTYIETTMGNSIVGTNTTSTRDHFWNVSSNVDGRHRFIQSPAFTVGGVAANPVLGTGMDTVLFPKTTNGKVQWFVRNSSYVYQWMPTVITGSVDIQSSSNYVEVATLPANVYGQIYFFYAPDKSVSASGVISSDTSIAKGWTTRVKSDSSGLDQYAIELQNKNAADLKIYARRGDSSSSFNGSWNFTLLYWAF